MKFKLTPGVTFSESLRELERAVNNILDLLDELHDSMEAEAEPDCTCGSDYTGLPHAPYCPVRR
jgi:hypothetical protein